MKIFYSILLLLLTQSIVAQNKCACGDSAKKESTADLEKSVDSLCGTCGLGENENVLVYDSKCKKLYFRECKGKVKYVDNLSDIHLNYKKPVRIKLIHFNRYLYNVNLGNSDIAFTSTESQVMQQYLIAGSNNGQITPYNSYSHGVSENGGDYVFSIISAFKANLDMLLSKIDYAVTLKQKQGIKVIAARDNSNLFIASPELDPASAKNRVKIEEIKQLNNYNDSLDIIANKIIEIQKCITASTGKKECPGDSKLPELFNDFAKKGNQIINQIEKNKKGHYTSLKKDPNYVKFKINIIGLTQSAKDSVLLPTGDSISIRAEALKQSFLKLGQRYNSFIDNKIKAYSICTDSFSCCKDPGHMMLYSTFDTLLNNIAKNFYLLKYAMNAEIIPAAKDNTKPVKEDKKSVEKKAGQESNADILKIQSSDIVFEDGKITGIKLHQTATTEKPQKPEPEKPTPLPFAEIDSLWFLFEKSISADYIMRQILFNNNMVAGNMSYTSPPIYPYGDRLGLVMQISPSDSVKKMGTMPTNTETISLDFPVFGKPMFSFSAGTFFGFGNQLKSPTYEFQQVPVAGSNVVESASPYKLVQTGNGSMPIGIDGLANVTWRKRLWFSPKTDFRIGISGGVGAVIEPAPVRVAYLLGATGSLGTYQQFHFTFGITGMNVSSLKDNLKNSAVIYNTSPGNIQYNQTVKPGLFFSVSYTIFNLKTTGNVQNGIINNNGTK